MLRREQRREALLDLVISLLPGSPKQGSSATGCVWVCMCETVNESDQPAPDTASSSFQSLESLSQRHFHYFFLPLLPQGWARRDPWEGVKLHPTQPSRKCPWEEQTWGLGRLHSSVCLWKVTPSWDSWV